MVDVYVSPLDGQTGVSVELPLLVRTDGMELPPEAALPADFISVVALDEEGFVEGAITRTGDDVRFRPRGGWRPDARYAWRVEAFSEGTRRPEARVPPILVGEAVFSTGRELWLLDLTLDPEIGELCAIFSRPIAPGDADRITLTVDDKPQPARAFTAFTEARFHQVWLPDKDHGVSVACALLEDVAPGDAVRMWLEPDGPWLRGVDERPVAELLMQRRRERQ